MWRAASIHVDSTYLSDSQLWTRSVTGKLHYPSALTKNNLNTFWNHQVRSRRRKRHGLHRSGQRAAPPHPNRGKIQVSIGIRPNPRASGSRKPRNEGVTTGHKTRRFTTTKTQSFPATRFPYSNSRDAANECAPRPSDRRETYFASAAAGCHNSIGFPSGSFKCANRPYGDISASTFTAIPAACSCDAIFSMSFTRKLIIHCLERSLPKYFVVSENAVNEVFPASCFHTGTETPRLS